ncbi:MAG: hypothetical protein NT149_02360 [Candidatus Gottesmanbacteria bacterium]|nr:hypothetical protein [Candidatus Gottesmanbacteria bacterium]
MRIMRWLGVVAFAFLLLASATTTKAIAQATPDIRFILQTQAGLSAYATITNTISLDQVRPMFSSIEMENSDYIQGEYALSGRTDKVKLVIGNAGWAIAWHTRDYASQHLYDCPSFNGSLPAQIINRPERAILEVSNALGITAPTVGFYDFRNPQANGIIFHWLFLPGNGSQTSSIDLPLLNTYIERGYIFCTALSNSKLWLNSQIIDQQGSVSQVLYRYGVLGADQLRAGHTNNMKIEDLTFFGYGFVGGVTAEYSGTTPINISGGYRRDLTLAYPTILGQPITLYPIYIPILRK